ncbi:MAG: LemA family protein [Patescibacteria group bacterium]
MPYYAWILIILGIVLLWIVLAYNSLVSRRNQVDESWSDIDIQLKRRYDLIPNLIEAVKGYMTHEQKTLENVTKARTMAMSAKNMAEHAKTENMLSETLKSLFAVSENYPDLKASQNFLQLQDELSDTENKIQAARRFFNANTRDFNTVAQSFPTNIIANLFKFASREFFELKEEAAREAPKVSFK